jgi:hypothetical protein
MQRGERAVTMKDKCCGSLLAEGQSWVTEQSGVSTNQEQSHSTRCPDFNQKLGIGGDEERRQTTSKYTHQIARKESQGKTEEEEDSNLF